MLVPTQKDVPITIVMPLPLPTLAYVPKTNGNGHVKFTHKFDAASTALVEETGGLPALELERMTTHFYNNSFLDDTLDKFIGSHDDPHADKFARWINQKLLTGGSVWDELLPHLHMAVLFLLPIRVALYQTSSARSCKARWMNVETG
jgi:hypothetical protein